MPNSEPFYSNREIYEKLLDVEKKIDAYKNVSLYATITSSGAIGLSVILLVFVINNVH